MEVLSGAKKQGKEIKALRIAKEEIKLSLFEYDMNVYIGHPNEFIDN